MSLSHTHTHTHTHTQTPNEDFWVMKSSLAVTLLHSIDKTLRAFSLSDCFDVKFLHHVSSSAALENIFLIDVGICI